ncbi:MAG: TonB family protein [Proteobacteria bacterium]|nr:TonB family protein [Pseudomonadota bacterium]
MSVSAQAGVTPRDRLGFTLFIAASMHAALILGVGFTSSANDANDITVEVTLAQSNDREEPEDADFLASANQQGSGSESQLMETTTRQEVHFNEDTQRDVMTDPLSATPETLDQAKAILNTRMASEDSVTVFDAIPTEETVSPILSDNQTYEDLIKEIAALEARITQEEQANAKAPRVKRLTSVSTKTAVEAGYLNAWRQRVERIGNANYPSGSGHGDLRMLVVIRFDGTLEEVRILESSGVEALDQAALRTVRLAAPFQDFPVEMRQKYDQLEIIRTWQFSRQGTQLSG